MPDGASAAFIPHDIPLFEFDPAPVAVINPRPRRGVERLPERAVISWFGNVVAGRRVGRAVHAEIPFEHGPHPVVVVDDGGGPAVALVHAPVGAAGSASVLEVLVAMGARKVIGCGGAGIVVPGVDVGHVFVPVDAVRDEGTSYHYVPAGRPVRATPAAVDAITGVLRGAGVAYDTVTTWTTDAFFRETPAKVARRREQGCVTVEMEAAAMFAVAEFRGVGYGQLLYAGDDVSAQTWDHRGWDGRHDVRERLLDLAFACVRAW